MINWTRILHVCLFLRLFSLTVVGIERCSGKGLYATYILCSIDLSFHHKIMELTSRSVWNLS